MKLDDLPDDHEASTSILDAFALDYPMTWDDLRTHTPSLTPERLLANLDILSEAGVLLHNTEVFPSTWTLPRIVG